MNIIWIHFSILRQKLNKKDYNYHIFFRSNILYIVFNETIFHTSCYIIVLGFTKLIEDCDSLDLYGEKVPTEIYSIVGSSVYVSLVVIIDTQKIESAVDIQNKQQTAY